MCNEVGAFLGHSFLLSCRKLGSTFVNLPKIMYICRE